MSCRTIFENRPKPCMNGWGAVFLTVTPDGTALPCHSARQLPGLRFPNVRDHPVEWIWRESPGFNHFRGYDWMKEPCRSCPEKEKDFGGCRCQAFLLTGDARNADPGLRQVSLSRGGAGSHRTGGTLGEGDETCAAGIPQSEELEAALLRAIKLGIAPGA